MTGTPGTDAFGFPEEDTVTPDALTEEIAEQIAPAPAEGEQAEDTADEEEAPEAEEKEAAKAEAFYGGKYETREEFERAHREAERRIHRSLEEQRELEDQLAEYQEVMGDIQEIEAAVPAQPQWPQQGYPQQQYGQPQYGQEDYEMDPARLAQLAAEQAVGRQMAEFQAQLEVQQRQQWEAQEQESFATQVEEAVATFRSRHPDVTPDSEADQQVGEALNDLFEEESFADPDAVEIAYEAANNEALLAELRAQPHLVETDEGMETARALAALRQAQQPPGEKPARPKVFVETGGAAPPPAPEGTQPDDLYAAALAYDAQIKEAQKSPLGV